jgi:hypothetical protein
VKNSRNAGKNPAPSNTSLSRHSNQDLNLPDPSRLAVDYEQNTRDQRADSRDDVKYRAETQTKKTQAGDDQEDSEQDPFQLIHVHFISPLLILT